MPDLPQPGRANTLVKQARVTAIIEYLRNQQNQGGAIGPVDFDLVLGHRFIVQVVEKGPKDEADFTDNRYWCRLMYLLPTTTAVGEIDLLEDKSNEDIRMVVHHLGQQGGCTPLPTVEEPFPFASWPGPHALPKGTFLEAYYRVDGEIEKWISSTIPHLTVPVRIMEAEAGGGAYGGYELRPYTGKIPAGANATNAMLGENGPIRVRILNRWEAGTTGHILDPTAMPNVFDGQLIGTQDDGVRVYAISGVQLAKGQYQGMVYQMVTDLTTGFDRVRGHGLL